MTEIGFFILIGYISYIIRLLPLKSKLLQTKNFKNFRINARFLDLKLSRLLTKALDKNITPSKKLSRAIFLAAHIRHRSPHQLILPGYIPKHKAGYPTIEAQYFVK